MNKKRLIIISVLIVAGIIGIAIWHYVASFHSVTFTMTENVTADLYQVIDDTPQPTLKTIHAPERNSLQNGDYCVRPTDNKYNTTPICFTVQNKDMSIAIEPDYSSSRLAELLAPEQSQINALIQARYSPLIDNYILKDGQLYKRGQWYGATLTERVAPSDRGDVYRVLLEKKGTAWTIVAYPQIVLSKHRYPNVPFSVLDAVNRLPGVY